jgi:hypothetical protein
MDDDDNLTMEAGAAYLKMSLSHLNRLIKAGKGPPRIVISPKVKRLNLGDLRRYAEERKFASQASELAAVSVCPPNRRWRAAPSK